MTAPSTTTDPSQPEEPGVPIDTNNAPDSKSPPGIYLVNSGIRPSAKSILSPELLNKWYNQVHIPDILATSPPVISTAYRFSAVTIPPHSTSSPEADGNQGELPYLAIYPLPSTSLLTTSTSPLWKVPLTSEILPNKSKHIFELVDFQMGIWEKVIQLGPVTSLSDVRPSPAGIFLALVGISQDELGEAQAGSDSEGILLWSVVVEDAEVKGGKRLPTPRAKRSTLVGWVEYHPPGAPAPISGENGGETEKAGVELSGYRRYLGIHEYDELPAGKLVGNNGAPVYLFSALYSSGDVSKAW